MGNNEHITERTKSCLRLQTKLSISFSVLTIFISAILTFALYMTVRGQLYQDIRQRLFDIVNIAAMQIDGDCACESD